jgi:PAS domain S-box-containing protein
MNPKPQISPFMQRFHRISVQVCFALICGISFLDILGWIFDISFLKSIGAEWVPMKPVTALCFFLCASSLPFILTRPVHKFLRYIPVIFGIVVSILGGCSIAVYFNLHIHGTEPVFTSAPGLNFLFAQEWKMALVTAINFLFIGITIILQSSHSKRASGFSHALIIVPIVLSYLVPLSYFLGEAGMTEVRTVPVALNSGIAFCLLCFGLLATRTGSWLMRIFLSGGAGSRMARKLLPGVILIPLGIAWFRIKGEQSGWFDSGAGVALVALTYTVCLAWLVWLTARPINKKDEEIRKNLETLAEAQRIGKIGSWERDIRTGEATWSDEMYRIFGENKDKLPATFKGFLNMVHPDDRARLEETIRESTRNRVPFSSEFRILRRDGSERTVLTQADMKTDAEHQPVSMFGTLLDITEMNHALQALRVSQERFSTTLSSIGDAVLATDLNGNITFMNRVCEDLTGWSMEDAINRPVHEIFNIINENTRLSVPSPVNHVLEKGMVVGLANHTILIRKDGAEIPIDDSGAPIRGQDGHTSGVVLVFRDITERKKAEKSLADSEQRYRHLVNCLPDSSVYLFDHDLQFLVAGGGEIVKSGFDPKLIEGHTLAEAFPPDVVALFEPLYRKALQGEASSFEHPYGEAYYFQQIHPVFDHTGKIYAGLVVSYNITERKRMEATSLAEARKYQILSELSHLFNTSGVSVPEMFNAICTSAVEAIGDMCIITRVSPDGQFLLPVAMHHPDPEARAMLQSILGTIRIPVGNGVAGKVSLSAEPALVSGIPGEEMKRMVNPEFRAFMDRFGVNDFLIVPMKTDGQVIGTIGLMRVRQSQTYTREDQAFLEVIAGRAAMAIISNQLNEALKASHDELEQKVSERTEELHQAMLTLAREQSRLNDVLDKFPSYVALLTPDHRIAFCNHEFKRRFGEPDDRKCYQHLFGRDEPCEVCHTYDVLRTNSPVLWDWEGPDGCIYDIKDFPFADTAGGKLILEIGTDVTQIRQAEADRVARQVAEQSNLAKSEFLANISHEIRTPMNSIIGFSELLASTLKSEKQKSQVNAIRSSGKNLLTLINDILDLSKIEAGKMMMNPEPVRIQMIIDEIEVIYAQKAKNKGIGFFIEIEKEISGPVFLDDTRLRQILFNLLDNAIKFTEHGQVILVFDRVLKQKDCVDLLFSVEDTGIGILSDNKDLIFNAFVQIKGLPEKKYGGTGLGLTITRRLVELMGGTITMSSEPGKGSIFTVLLPDVPLRPGPGHVRENKSEFDIRSVRFRKSKVLIVDDNLENRKLLTDFFESSPIEVIEAVNGKEAVDIAAQWAPDLILMDLRMPEMNGYRATEILKSQESTANIPVIAVSASPKIIMDGVSTKDIFDDFIMKPVNLEDLARLLTPYLSPGPRKTDRRKTVSYGTRETPPVPKPLQKLTTKQRRQLQELVSTLENEYLPVCNEALRKQMISQMGVFGKNLVRLGENSGFAIVREYGGEICLAVDSFQVDELVERLRSFPGIIEQIKTMLEDGS